VTIDDMMNLKIGDVVYWDALDVSRNLYSLIVTGVRGRESSIETLMTYHSNGLLRREVRFVGRSEANRIFRSPFDAFMSHMERGFTR
jgi:hypothetical protein